MNILKLIPLNSGKTAKTVKTGLKKYSIFDRKCIYSTIFNNTFKVVLDYYKKWRIYKNTSNRKLYAYHCNEVYNVTSGKIIIRKSFSEFLLCTINFCKVKFITQIVCVMKIITQTSNTNLQKLSTRTYVWV